MTESIKIDIEQIANDMMERSKLFYRDPKNERHIQRCIEYRDDLQSLKKQIEEKPDSLLIEREREIKKILINAIADINERIKKLRRAH